MAERTTNELKVRLQATALRIEELHRTADEYPLNDSSSGAFFIIGQVRALIDQALRLLDGEDPKTVVKDWNRIMEGEAR